MLRQKGYSFINIIGLAVGLASVILILLWVKYEFSYDKANSNFERIYRLGQTQFYSSGPLNTFSMPGPMAARIKSDFPEIEEAFRFSYSGLIVRYEEKKFSEEVLYADKEIFNVFDIELIRGTKEDVFKDFNSVILSEEMAEKYFGSVDPVGKILTFNNKRSMKVSGVFKNMPQNTSLGFKMCIPFEHIEEDWGVDLTRWGWNSFGTYVLIKEGVSWEEAETKIKHFIPIATENEESTNELWLWPLKKIHLYRYSGGGMIKTIYMFILIAAVILVIACINFMNLATARSSKRSKEIGLRKVMGAYRKHVINQFLGESVLTAFLALIIAILMVNLILPSFNTLTEKDMVFNFTDPIVLGGLIGLTILTGVFAGSYPALFLSSFRPIIVLKGAINKGKSGSLFRKVLVVFQFTLSIALIISTIIITKQLYFIQNKDIGMRNENVIFLRMQGEVNSKFETVKPLLLQNPKIEHISRCNQLPFMIGSNSGSIGWDGKTEEEDVLVGFTFVDVDFEKVMSMEVLEGRYFSSEYGTDSSAAVLNENAVKVMGLENPVGSWLSWGENHRFNIIGVVKDYNFEHMSQEVSPMAIFNSGDRANFMLIKMNKADVKETIAFIEETWNTVFPNYPFAYTFMEDRYREMYTREEKSSELFKYFAILAIFISALGLFGLTSYLAEQKTKEIGIRKALGSSVFGIVQIMSKEFVRLIIIANVIAWPLTWYIGSQLLSNYAYRTKMSLWIFAAATAASFLIAFLTISYQSIKSGRAKPIDALRYE